MLLKFFNRVDSRFFLLFTILFSTLFLSFEANELSISYSEAKIFFYEDTLLSYLIHLSTYLLGQNDFGLRVFFILFNIINITLVYEISLNYFKNQKDSNLILLLYVLSPATISASILINQANIVIFCILLYIYFYQKSPQKSLYLLPIFIFIDNSFFILYFSLFFYSLNIKDNRLLIVSLLFFGVSMYTYGFTMDGKPKNYFLDTLSIYATLFSPLLFVYMFYSLYRVLIKGNKSIIWYISFIPLIFSLLISFRQKIYIEDFAPYILIGLFISIQVFYSSLRVRLPEFRKKIEFLLYLVLTLLVINLILVSSNKILYYFTDKPSSHFAYKYQIAKELAKELKEIGVYSISTTNKELQLRLKFYGISNSNKVSLTKIHKKGDKKVSIRYMDKVVAEYFVTKVNKNI
jgi:hypothetical protein